MLVGPLFGWLDILSICSSSTDQDKPKTTGTIAMKFYTDMGRVPRIWFLIFLMTLSP